MEEKEAAENEKGEAKVKTESRNGIPPLPSPILNEEEEGSSEEENAPPRLIVVVVFAVVVGVVGVVVVVPRPISHLKTSPLVWEKNFGAVKSKTDADNADEDEDDPVGETKVKLLPL